ncbi:HET-domain-containing protein [Hyaloscypha bicolor E]|uniref:HET-domain-containing protein n=1 Tax=Hyaloscypha bicolor E TaxID=1095630 RepID=A0A2J6TGQ0_9HELO|nr:HET-domain-containing protein [Hyaloscypha bicolor E]PMD62190.1 HET-domain-containing protein [Hyaloscypha bicolor E]
MWLINTTSLALEFTEDPETCIYAILSHTWGDDEVGFQDMANLERARKKQGFSKIERTCQLAHDRNIEYAWVDTCCIDKSSSAELTEAINSMFRWYKQSHVCFVFLSDLLSFDSWRIGGYLRQCRWFTRGWTLQELIAPEEIEFYDRGWNLIGTNDSLQGHLTEITGIDAEILNDSDMLQAVPVARRMSWAASRQTTRVEDLAYCMFGIFDVNLPLIYGEGQKAFIRLQEAISRENNDLSLFAWTCPNERMLPLHRRRKFRGILAESPAEFRECSGLQRISDPGIIPAEVTITNQGFRIRNMLSDGEGEYLLNLNCIAGSYDSVIGLTGTIVIRLARTAHGYVRHQFSGHTFVHPSLVQKSAMSSLPIPKTISPAESQLIRSRLRHRFSFDFIADVPFLECEIQRKPLHLWDHATKSFITDGYEAFTGIIEINATGNIPKIISGYEHDCTFRLDPMPVVIFGLEPVSISNKSIDSGKELKPWAGIYTPEGQGETCRAIEKILAQEKTHGFPHVARKAREFVLSRQDTPSPLLPRKCEHRAVSRTINLSHLDPEKEGQVVESVLSTYLEETSDLSLYKMRLDFTRLLGLPVPPEDETMWDSIRDL